MKPPGLHCSRPRAVEVVVVVCGGGSGGLFWVRGCSAAALGVFAVAQAARRALLPHQGKAGTGVVVCRGHFSISP